MAHTRTWSNVTPDVTGLVGYGAQEIQNARLDVQERMSQTHVWNYSTTDDGEHMYDKLYSVSTSGGSLTVSSSNGWTQKITLGHNVSISLSLTAPPSGFMRVLTLILLQDGTGGRTVTWPASVKWPYSITPTLDTTLSTASVVQLWTSDGGTTWLGALVGSKYAGS